jgi:hypothetical protein
MELDALFKWLFDTPVAITIRENESLFPWIESFHVLAITLVVGSIAIVDLRLLGFASLDRAVTRLTKEVLPCTWAAFAVAAMTGAALFSSNAVNYAHNFFFQGKMALLVLAGINMLIFQLLVSRNIERWEALSRTPMAAKVAAAASLILWVGVVGFGRWIGFTLQPTLAG